MRRLALKLPTALQVEEEHAMLFHDGGTSQFTSLASAVRYMGLEFDDPSSRIWALVDSSQLLSEPAPIFRASGPFFVVEAASRRSCFEWAERVHHRYFYMKTWTFSEVLQVYVASCPKVYRSRFLQPSVHGTLTGRPSRRI